MRLRATLLGMAMTAFSLVFAQPAGDPMVLTEFYGIPGDAPVGLLLFFLADDGPTRPKLVVELGADSTTDRLVAHVYDAPPGLDYVPVLASGPTPSLPPSAVPAVTITAHGATWQSDGVPNFDLDVAVHGPIYAMWGTSVSQRFMEVPRQAPLATVMVRSDEAGLPKWDLRMLTALDHFRGEGIYRLNYAERECETPLVVQPSVTSVWPYVSTTGGDLARLASGRLFEQKNGVLEPPIVVDWAAGRIVTFSEIVTARNQNCSYAAYSFDEFVPGELNDANFETPFAFYDLSGNGHGFPNLILRTERYRPGDRWSTGIDPARQRGRPTLVDIVNVRYSWALGVGSGAFDFKVDVVGPKPYEYETGIADGYGAITAPGYEAFPSWVIDQEWPAVAFIGVEGRRYVSNEGIYSWFGATELGAYATGQAADAGPDPYGLDGRGGSRMAPGLRGEVVFGQNILPRLYLSTVDNRLHLHGAERGTWLIDSSSRLDVRAVPGASEINHWQLVEGGAVVAELVDFGSHLVFADDSGVTLRANAAPRVLFSIAPPTDHESWQTFGALVEPFSAIRRDPHDLARWLEAFPGETWFIPNARFNSPIVRERGFQLVVEAGIARIWPGSLPSASVDVIIERAVVLRFDDGVWSHANPTGPAIAAAIVSDEVVSVGEQQVTLILENRGDTALASPVALRIGEVDVWERVGIDVGEVLTVSVPWMPEGPGSYNATLIAGEETHVIDSLQVVRANRIGGLAAIALSTGSRWEAALLLGVAAIASLLLAWLARSWLATP